jgi:hypothetical protein
MNTHSIQVRLASPTGMVSLRELQSQTGEDLEANLATSWVGG